MASIPAMGWLFAVALGLHRQSRAVVLVSLVPIAIGHALSIAVVAGLLLTADYLVPQAWCASVRPSCCWPGRPIIGATAIAIACVSACRSGFAGSAVWSFLMATAHGAGLMLWPALMPLCFPSAPGTATFAGPVAAAFAGVGVHSLAMILTTAVVAVAVHDWLGVGVIRHAWLNLDLIWRFALFTTGALLLVV